MKCPKCGLENRPDARFCKQCGQALAQQAVPPAIPVNICPACGVTTKPKARFCPRCGKPLASDLTQPSFSVTDTAPTPSSITQPYATPPSPPPPIVPSNHTQPWVPPPRPPAPVTSEHSFPRWVIWIAIITVFICVAALIVAVITFGPKLTGNKLEPAETPTPKSHTRANAPLDMQENSPATMTVSSEHGVEVSIARGGIQ
ncbi:MAG: zinc ribbon domain-containing protein [Chloroflexi bacterium]|nr:zinc ribbon domain-containing protein [Chloroflexota bacterium]